MFSMTTEENNSDIEVCEECTSEINCIKENIFIVTKEEEEKILCHSCFEHLWKQYIENGWGGDDIEYYLEMEKEEKV
jgi:uncharacterized protein with PIN domain